MSNNAAAHRAAEEKVQNSEQAGTSAHEPGDARKIDQFPEDVSTIVVHHSSILRNKRLLLAYRLTCTRPYTAVDVQQTPQTQLPAFTYNQNIDALNSG